MNLFSETYSPNANKELPKFNGGPHTLTATVIGNDPVQELTYNPRGDDDLTKGYSARLPNSSFSRMLHTTASTVNGPVQSELPLSTGNYITKEYTGVFQPKITITTPVEKVSLRTPLNVLVERDVSPDDIAIGGYGPGTARQIIAENPAGIAQIFYDNRGAFALSNDVNRSYGGWLFFFNDKGTSGSQGELKTLTLIDHTRNRVSYTSANSAPGTFFAIDILPTPAGESFIDQLKSYFRVPNDVENKQWVHKPGTYQK
jgi:hypothetical protein